jgi:hypothetical protein
MVPSEALAKEGDQLPFAFRATDGRPALSVSSFESAVS